MLVATLALALHILPAPTSVTPVACPGGTAPIPAYAGSGIDAGALEILNERWRALRIGAVSGGTSLRVRFVREHEIVPQGYRLISDGVGVTIASSDRDGAFYGVTTLAQLPLNTAAGWRLPCVRIDDRPALRWRILSDDVSRGPLPSMRYFKERIRTIAAFKMNGYSPYFESVFRSPTDPLPAPDDGITPSELRELVHYARAFHVTFIPEQQTFAHMHATLRVEQYAAAAEFPHGFLLSPSSTLATNYLERVIAQERDAVGATPFFHIGSDETATLGEGTTAGYVAAHGGRSAVFAEHVNAMAKLVAPARVMLWDDGIEADPSIMAKIPRNAVVVNWHYDARATYRPFIDTIARGGLEQMVAPGANNWNEIFPNVAVAVPNEQRFISEGEAAHVLGLFQTVWHDDGETLYEATWYPVLYAASQAWNARTTPDAFRSSFAQAFFGASDSRLATDAVHLGQLDAQLGGSTDKLFWSDPFSAASAARAAKIDLRAVRLAAEAVATDLLSAPQPRLHANAARVMLLSARRFDALGRRFQIAREVRFYYDHAKDHPDDAVRDLFWCKYWFWELRDADEALESQYAVAWRYESRDGHLASNLERYHLDAQRAIDRADAIDRATYDTYLPTKTLPDLDGILGVTRSQ